MKLTKVLPIVLFFALLIVSCSPKSKEQKSEGTDSDTTSVKIEKVKISVLQPQVIAKDIEYTSTLKAFEEVNLVPSTPGRIEKIFVEIGNRVKKGDILVQMDQTQLQQAILQLKNLETDFQRLDTLQKVGSITKQQFDQVSTQYEVAKKNVDFLRENTKLLAPFDGIISGKYFENGEMYSALPNTTVGKAAIISIVQINPLKAQVNIPETYYPLVSVGLKTDIICDIYPDEKFVGNILRKYPTIDPMSHSFTVELRVNNPGEKLRPGMFCRVNLILGEIKALVAPSLAVLKMQGSNERYIFLEKDGKARRVAVTIGKRYDENVELVTSELKEGDHLIVVGQSSLIDGQPVEVVTE